MDYSSKALARLSGVSVRTLHYYDEINLLNPIARMVNGRRLYGPDELLRLMEIIFFKEIGFDLERIRAILSVKNLNKTSILAVQKELLQKKICMLEESIRSIDRTITYYKGSKMNKKEVAEHLASCQRKAKEYTEEYIELCEKNFGKEKINKCRQKLETIDKGELEKLGQRSLSLANSLKEAIDNNLVESSPEVQRLMLEHFEISSTFESMTKEAYRSSMDCLRKDSDFYVKYQKMHPKLPEFLYKAMEIFLNTKMKAL